MSKKSPTKSLSNTKMLLCHKIPNRQGQEPKSLSTSNHRLLILSTPIKLKDGTVNMEQRTIPLRIDNAQLTITATENKNKIISLKRTIEPSPLALPINQINKKSPTFVKNEVGQVMGKIIPLGKFADITQNSSSPINSPFDTPITGVKNLKQDVTNFRGKKVLRFDKKCAQTSEPKEKINESSIVEVETQNTPHTSSAIVSTVEIAKEQVITIADIKPKKQVHLVLKRCKDTARIAETGTKIKLMPIKNWKMDEESKLTFNHSTISQPRIVGVRSCTVDEMNKADDQLQFEDIKSNFNFDKVDFDVDNILEKDSSLDDGVILSKQTKRLDHLSENDVGTKRELKLPEQCYGSNKFDRLRTISESGRLNSSKVLTLAKGGMNVELKYENKIKAESQWGQKANTLSKTLIVDSKSTETAPDGNTKNLDPANNNLSEKVEDVTGVKKVDVNYDVLYKRFGINKNNVTATETAMLSYICNLKKKLSQSQRSRVQALTALKPRVYFGNNNLSNIQKRFVETQLRNSGRLQNKPRFMRTDLAMAKDILKAAGPRGYSNLRKLFSLPDMSAVVKAVSRT